MRLPGLYNHKYEKPYLVRAEEISREIYRPEHFPQVGTEGPGSRATQAPMPGARGGHAKPAGSNTQSEHDWAYARRALARGDDPEQVIQAIELYRSGKPNPGYYAAHTVEKAAAKQGKHPDQDHQPTPDRPADRFLHAADYAR